MLNGIVLQANIFTLEIYKTFHTFRFLTKNMQLLSCATNVLFKEKLGYDILVFCPVDFILEDCTNFL